MLKAEDLSALILAGGRGKRMQGQDKAALIFRGKSLLDHLLEELQPCREILLSVRSLEQYPHAPCPRLPDRENRGPLEGIANGLRFCQSPWLLVIACDMPLFQLSLTARLLKALSEEKADAAVFREPHGFTHPLCAMYAKTALPVLEDQLNTGHFKILDSLDRLSVCYLAPNAQESLQLCNINTVEAWRTLHDLQE